MKSKERKTDGEKLTSLQNLHAIGCGTLPTTVWTPIEIGNFRKPKTDFKDMCGSKHTLGILKNTSFYTSLKASEFNWVIKNVSDFELKLLQRVSF